MQQAFPESAERIKAIAEISEALALEGQKKKVKETEVEVSEEPAKQSLVE